MTQPPNQPFEGLRVLDFCWVVIGPMTTRYFSDFGAEVLRVESSLRPDVIRHGLPFAEGKPGTNRSGYWANYNSGKLGLGLNMADERSRNIAFRLATEWADVVTENFTPGTMEKWGLGYDALRRHNPGLVMFSASMLGRGGPYDSQPGFGPVLTALSGHTNFTGWPDRVPVSPYGRTRTSSSPTSPTPPSVPRWTIGGAPAGGSTWTSRSWKPRSTSRERR